MGSDAARDSLTLAMIKTIVKLAIVALIANAIWRLGSSYVSFYRFRDSVDEMALHSKGKTVEEMKDKVLDLAASYEEPLDADALSVRRDEPHLIIDGAYKKKVLLAPGVEYAWPFTLHVDEMVITPLKLGDLNNP
jgi:hypothetical protein